MMHARRVAALALPVLLVAAAAQAPQAPEKVTLQSIKYAELGKFVRSLTGKVVVVNFWAEY